MDAVQLKNPLNILKKKHASHQRLSIIFTSIKGGGIEMEMRVHTN